MPFCVFEGVDFPDTTTGVPPPDSMVVYVAMRNPEK